MGIGWKDPNVYHANNPNAPPAPPTTASTANPPSSSTTTNASPANQALFSIMALALPVWKIATAVSILMSAYSVKKSICQ